MVTIKDVAREAGVSVTTASRALNKHGDVAEATRAHVTRVARRLDYHPNVMARGLQNSRADAVGLIVPMVLHRAHDPFWFDFIGGMAAVCAERGRDLLVSATDDGDANEEHFQRMLRGRRVDGLLICDLRQNDERVRVLRAQGLPFVAFGRVLGHDDFCYIDVDGEAGVLEAVRHLIELGHRRIGFMGVAPEFSFSHFRVMGYRRALVQAGLPFDDDLVRESVTEASAGTVLRTLLELSAPPTAIFVAADFLALTVLKTARSMGVAIPNDLSLSVFDDSPIVQHAVPPLTAVSQPNRRLGEEAARLLLDRVDRPRAPLVQRLIVPTLVARASTCPPPTRRTDRRTG